MKSSLKSIIKNDNEYLFQNYGDRLPVSFIDSKDDILIDQDNKEYIDFFSGIAVNTLGYGDLDFKQTLKNQIDNIIHSSNWYFNKEQINAAKLISDLSFKGKTLFVNSGTEANEAAIKLARLYGLSKSATKYNIISFENSFHGRTMGAMTATAQEKIHKGFGPLTPGFIYLPFNDIKRFKNAVNEQNVCAVIFEPIQGEGGINLIEVDFLQKIKEICIKNDILLISDEVQTGIARTGKYFGYQHTNITPDIITLAKGLGSGIPIGALHTTDEISKHFSAGKHGTTFGGNHLACAAASFVLTRIKNPSFLNHVNELSDYFFKELNNFKDNSNKIKEVRGLGLHIGIELNESGMHYVKSALKEGLIINCTANKVIRIMPPLTLSLESTHKGMQILKKVLRG